jgi:hypothetical protein
VLKGWSTSSLASGDNIAVVHHPGGFTPPSFDSHMRLSLGHRDSQTDTNFWIVRYDEGSTEGGSSGSPLIAVSGKQVRGQLSYGSAACGNNLTDGYGKFSVAYNQGVYGGLVDYLDTTASPPCAVELYGLSALAGRDRVTIRWQTSWEVDNSHFEVLRSTEGGPYEVIATVPSDPLFLYEYVDTAVTQGVRYDYRVDDVDLSGVHTAHGPVWAIPEPADVDGSQRVDGKDLIALSQAMGSTQGTAVWNAYADIDGNGIVDEADEALLNDAFGMVLSEAGRDGR